MLEKELSVKGWNWGRAEFSGSTMSFEVGNHTAFEIPLSNVSQCTTGKNEVTLEFHQVGTIMTSNAADILLSVFFKNRMMMHQSV